MALLHPVLLQLWQQLNSTPYTLCCSVLCLIGFFYLLNKLNRSSKPINLPPCPPKLPIIGNLHQLGKMPHRSLRALSHKYGSLMLLHLGKNPTLVVSSAALAREMIKSHDLVFSSRPSSTAANILLYGCKDVGFAPYGEYWRQARKVCVLELLSLKRVQSFQFVRDEEVEQLVSRLRNCNGASANISAMLTAIVNNIISRCVIGQKFEAEDGKKWFGKISKNVMVQLTAFSVGDFFPSLGWIDVLTGLIRRLKVTFGELDAFFDQVITQHKMMKRDDHDHCHAEDFVNILVKLQQDGVLDFELTQDNLKAILIDMFVGGSDTTSTALEWAFAELMKSPVAMKKAQEEVRRVVGNKSKVEESDINQMKYLKCVLKETLRLHPSLPLLVPRETLSSVKFGGYDIPQKTRVFVNSWAIQRDPEIWERPEEFLPERFENSQVDFKGHDFEFIPFGAGRRGCPGMSFGIASAEYVMANLLHWFDWELPKTSKAKDNLDMSEVYGLTVHKKVSLCLVPKPYSF
ncbi:Cytochrome P450 [Quillaja saponaria]|uniref:Cytochrome P450 n=1 Tax=Quillaja saponaria TaxID=32244 RepID=A0AAD7PIH4_QUISA|nr:Cytochrome P450 [Quillaja saponaria]